MLKKGLLYLLKNALFWYIYFALFRSIFLVYNYPKIQHIGTNEILSTHYHALYLDTSMVCYVLSPTVLLMLLSFLSGKKIFFTINIWYVGVILSVLTLIYIAELEIHKEWGTKINAKALSYLEQPDEILNTVRPVFLFVGLTVIAALVFLLLKFYKRFCKKEIYTDKKYLQSTILFVAIIPTLFIGIRGGFQQIPIQVSEAYFSRHNILNLASVNTGWNLINSIIENKKVLSGNPFVFYNFEQAKKTVEQIHFAEKDSTLMILDTTRPNIVMVILESWSAEMIEGMGGFKGMTPNFDKLIETGVIFDSIYASGNLSDQGMAALFAAFPAQPYTSIITQPAKYTQLPAFNLILRNAGYFTSYMFGGQLSYGNIKAYMYYNDFDRIQEEKDFASHIPRAKLGVHDEYIYQRLIEDVNNDKEPFFAGMFTISTHSPYDIPDRTKYFVFNSYEDDYANAFYYADKCIGNFIQHASKQKWFNNTLFVFIADHSHGTPKGIDRNYAEYRRIPMLFWGNVIKDEYKGLRVKKIGSQIDLASTLLTQLKLSTEKFPWSKNLLNYYCPEFAYYENTDGFGWIRPDGYYVYSHERKEVFIEKFYNPTYKDSLIKEGKSYLQVLFQQYTDF